jgi:hypothetical protein
MREVENQKIDKGHPPSPEKFRYRKQLATLCDRSIFMPDERLMSNVLYNYYSLLKLMYVPFIERIRRLHLKVVVFLSAYLLLNNVKNLHYSTAKNLLLMLMISTFDFNFALVECRDVCNLLDNPTC